MKTAFSQVQLVWTVKVLWSRQINTCSCSCEMCVACDYDCANKHLQLFEWNLGEFWLWFCVDCELLLYKGKTTEQVNSLWTMIMQVMIIILPCVLCLDCEFTSVICVDSWLWLPISERQATAIQVKSV